MGSPISKFVVLSVLFNAFNALKVAYQDNFHAHLDHDQTVFYEQRTTSQIRMGEHGAIAAKPEYRKLVRENGRWWVVAKTVDPAQEDQLERGWQTLMELGKIDTRFMFENHEYVLWMDTHERDDLEERLNTEIFFMRAVDNQFDRIPVRRERETWQKWIASDGHTWDEFEDCIRDSSEQDRQNCDQMGEWHQIRGKPATNVRNALRGEDGLQTLLTENYELLDCLRGHMDNPRQGEERRQAARMAAQPRGGAESDEHDEDVEGARRRLSSLIG